MGTNTSGKREHQKLKAYLILQILQRETDEAHTMSAPEIAAALDEFGIEAERRGIYKDIDEINKVLYLLENECTIQEAEEAIDDPEYGDDEKLIVYDSSRKGFYVRHRKYDLIDMRLLAECVYFSKFLSKSQSDRLVDVICGFVSREQQKKIKHDAVLTDRVKTSNKAILNNINEIDEAMRTGTRKNPHQPEKIRVEYEKSVMGERSLSSSVRTVVLSPYALMINEGFYYLLAYHGKSIGFWRVDRMKSVKLTGEPRDCDEEYSELDLQDYAQRNFGMMINAKKMRVTLLCHKNLLDTMLDRFGKKNIRYIWVDKNHFSCDPMIELTHQFYGWLCGFGNEIKIIEPVDIAERYAVYLDKIRSLY